MGDLQGLKSVALKMRELEVSSLRMGGQYLYIQVATPWHVGFVLSTLTEPRVSPF